jgi:phage terminase large subunit
VEGFDFLNPDYAPIFKERLESLNRIRENKKDLPLIKAYYKEKPAKFITDWGVTMDPRNVERGLPALVPFVLFPKQEEWVYWIMDHWHGRRPGLVEKTRDMGMSWLSVSLACTLCIFHPGMAVGFGSRKEEYVDRIGAPKSLLHKARVFMSHLPVEFRGTWDIKEHAPHMRIIFPDNGSNISGEAGDNIGRGDRTGIYFVDEAAFLERPELVEASLSQTSNCRIDISSANGMANPFAQKRHSGKIDVFTFHWRDDPRKDQDWYDQQVINLDPVTLAQEIDINYSASVEGVLCPGAWVRSAVDAHKKLGFDAVGLRAGALDVADEGIDLNAFCGAHGMLIDHISEWSGKGDDIFGTVQKAFHLCDDLGYVSFKYDSDGIGAGVRGDARIVNGMRRQAITVEPFRGSAGVFNPEGQDVRGRKNIDFFQNCKAQAWWALRTRFQKTYRSIHEGAYYPPDQLISIDGKLPLLDKLLNELSQPTYQINGVGKIVVDKTPEGTRSPNLADAVMIRFSMALRAPMAINKAAIAAI